MRSVATLADRGPRLACGPARIQHARLDAARHGCGWGFRQSRASGRIASLLAVLPLLGGCVVGPDFETPAAPDVAGYLPGKLEKSLDSGARIAWDSQLSANWWGALGSHQLNELIELGLKDRLDANAVATRELVYSNCHGQVVWREDRGLAAGYHWPQYSIHRGTLHMLLFQAARERLGAGRVHVSARVAGFEQDETGVTLRLADGRAARGDLLVGADGIHSTIRAHFHPNEGPPRWNGCILWRATSVAAPFLTGATMVQAGHHNQKFVTYPIAELPDGRRLTNWIAERRLEPDHVWPREDWNRPGRIEDILPHFEGWNFGWLDVPELIRTTDAVYEFPMVDRDPLGTWNHGRVTLLGDAAHPMYPIGSNGASQGILDARTFAHRLATLPDWREALVSYDAVRRPATAALVAATRGLGPDLVLERAHERAPQGFDDIETILPFAERQEIASRFKRLAGFDPAVLNARPSLNVERAA